MADRFLVIGSNSFTGAHFVDHALAAGAEVVGTSRSAEPHEAFLPYRRHASPRFRFVEADLNHHLDRLMGVVDEFRPDYVVNFASQSMVAESWAHPEHWFQTNAVATVRLHDQLRQRSFLKKYVHISTPEVYGSCAGAVTEDAPMNPSTPYAVSRAAADMSLLTFHRAYGFPVVFTRAANVFGPGQQLYRLVPRAILSIRAGRKLPLHGGGHSRRSFIHVGDVVRATHLIATQAAPPEVFHLSTNELRSIREVVEEICRQMGTSFQDAVEVVGERLGKDSAYILESRKARERLGWTADLSFQQGIADTIAWVDQHLAALQAMPWDYVHKP